MKGLTSVFGGGKDSTAPVSNFKPSGFSGGGLTGRYSGGNFNVSSSGFRDGLFSDLSNVYQNTADEFGNLLPLVDVGTGQLTQARVNSVRDAARKSIGDLSESLKRRRVFGSSFANDSVARAEGEFAKAEGEERAKSFLEELQLKTNILTQKNEFAAQSVQTIIDKLNLEANAATQLASGATSALAATSQAHAQLLQTQNNNALDVVGTIAGAGFGLI